MIGDEKYIVYKKHRMQDIARKMKWTTIIRYQILNENYSVLMMEFGVCQLWPSSGETNDSDKLY